MSDYDDAWYDRLDADLHDLLAALAAFYTPDDRFTVEALLTEGDYGAAFEAMCAIALEDRHAWPRQVRPHVRDLAERMGTHPSWWTPLRYREYR